MKSSELKSKLLAWLEKQGEQKPTLRERYKNIANSEWFKKTYEGMSISDDEEVNNVNKIEPKFKVGDWITNDACTIQITSIDDRYYWHDNDCVGGDIESVDKEYHLWTIDDAKDGDILVGKIDGDDYILIFKQIKDGWIETYGHYYNTVDRFCAPSQLFCKDYKGAFYPATEEECDILFEKMKEAGYEWDAEKKELKKISQCMVSEEAKEAGYDKPAWSEEDEVYLNTTIAYLKDAQEFKKTAEKCIVWLKSLRPQNNWKPSEEQMHALHDLNLTGNVFYAGQGQVLIGLYNDLKKLKGE